MTSKDEALAALEEAAAHMKSLTYEELSRLAAPGERDRSFRLSNRGWIRYGPIGHVERSWEIGDHTVYLATLIGSYGLIRKRVAVEMTLVTEDGEHCKDVASLYFERFKSGKLRQPAVRVWQIILLAIVLVAAIGVAVIL